MLSLRQALDVLGTSSVRAAMNDTGVIDPSVRQQMSRVLAKHEAAAAILKFHAETLGILVVGSPVGVAREVGNGAHEQRFSFGSVLKPLDGPPRYQTRFVATINIAAIKCFGTDDPDGTDQPYLVAAVYGVDPFVRERAVQTSEIHFGDQDEQSVFALGQPLTPSPIFIPGDGTIMVNLSLWDEEVASPNALQDKWRELASAAIIAGLTLLNPDVGAGAAVLRVIALSGSCWSRW
jgi:hypothetical protein